MMSSELLTYTPEVVGRRNQDRATDKRDNDGKLEDVRERTTGY